MSDIKLGDISYAVSQTGDGHMVYFKYIFIGRHPVNGDNLLAVISHDTKRNKWDENIIDLKEGQILNLFFGDRDEDLISKDKGHSLFLMSEDEYKIAILQ
jgi:hypothetical protein